MSSNSKPDRRNFADGIRHALFLCGVLTTCVSPSCVLFSGLPEAEFQQRFTSLLRISEDRQPTPGVGPVLHLDAACQYRQGGNDLPPSSVHDRILPELSSLISKTHTVHSG
jgi:hypothetical protein